MALLSYTVTNAALLCLVSGIIGGIASVVLPRPSTDPGPEPPAFGQQILAGALRGFAVYVLYVSGVYVGASDAFGHTTPEQYARVVATTSLLSFTVSYNPGLFGGFLDRFAPTSGPGTPPTATKP